MIIRRYKNPAGELLCSPGCAQMPALARWRSIRGPKDETVKTGTQCALAETLSLAGELVPVCAFLFAVYMLTLGDILGASL